MLADDWRGAARRTAEAERGFGAVGDRFGQQLAAVHSSLATIGMDRWKEDLGAAYAAGRWGSGPGSFSYALGLGTLCSRVARHWFIRRGDAERALACYRYAHALFDALGASADVVQNLADQADVLKDTGDAAGEVVTRERALTRCAVEADRRPELRNVLSEWRIRLTTDMWRIAQREANPDDMERTASRLRSLLPSEAEVARHLQQLAAGADPMPDFPGMALPSLDSVAMTPVLAACYRAEQLRDAGQDEEAQVQFGAAVQAAREAPPHLRDLLEALAHGYRKDWVAARQAYLRVVPSSGWSGTHLAAMVRTSRPAAEAQARANQWHFHSEAATFFCRIHAYDDALEHLRAVEKLAGTEWWRAEESPWSALALDAEVRAGLRQYSESLRRYDQAAAAIEERRGLLGSDELRAAFGGGWGVQQVFGGAVKAAFGLHEAARNSPGGAEAASAAALAWSYAERGKARALLDSMSLTAVLAGAITSESRPLRHWRECSARFTALRSQLAALLRQRTAGPRAQEAERELRAQVNDAERALRASELPLSRSFDPLASAAVPSVEEIARLLAPGTALLEYALIGDEAFAWSITSAGLAEAVRLPVDGRQLAWRIGELHQACSTDGQPWEAAAAGLSDALLKPLAASLRAHERLVIVPHGQAHRLPFHVLPWEGQPLIASRTVSYLPSAASLKVISSTRPAAAERPALVVGDPARMAYREPLSSAPVAPRPLRYAAVEAVYVASLTDGELLLREQATKQAVRDRISAARLLHFATHGHLSPEAPLLSSVLLADGESLTVYELLGVGLVADLVVLSACESGLGHVTGGDDVLGLSRGLLTAGARAAVVSLWPVNDLSTALLMREFYRHLLGGGSPATALRQAQIYLRGLRLEDALVLQPGIVT
jgi:CHAT domain-containing protein